MKIKRLNWALWSGLLLSIFAFLSYFLIFVWFPPMRDLPLANLALFALAILLLFLGVRRAFSHDQRLRSKVAASIAASVGVLILAAFIFTFYISGRALPRSNGAPHVGQKAPEFTLTDTNNRGVTLAELLSSPQDGKPPRGVLLIFYRGYW